MSDHKDLDLEGYGLYVCKRCDKPVPVREKSEHDDWHFAKDLQAQESSASTAPNPPSGAAVAAPVASTLKSAVRSPSPTPQSAPKSGSRPKSHQPGTGAAPAYSPSDNWEVVRHTNAVIEAAKVRAIDENEMQMELQRLQYNYQIYNSDIEPEHESETYCYCDIHAYTYKKWNRCPVQDRWSAAVMYPGEQAYNDGNQYSLGFFNNNNPYKNRVISPYGPFQSTWGQARPRPQYHAQAIHQTVSLNNTLNQQAQASIDAQEPRISIWDANALAALTAQIQLNAATGEKPGKLAAFKKSVGIRSQEAKALDRHMAFERQCVGLRAAILGEENGRWPSQRWRDLVQAYQSKIGMTNKLAHLRACQPIQYLHLLRAGYFEPIPIEWANQLSNPLKFTVEASSGWRGITPAWRGFEDTAEERLYWVLNHRDGNAAVRMKPDFISEMNMARARMATAVEPPPQYYAADDTCHVQHKSTGYSKQVMPSPFRAFDRPEVASDDTMVLLDVSGSMSFDPMRPTYDQYLVTGYVPSTQPKNKDVARAIVRRFTDAMANHDHEVRGYDLVTFANHATFIGTINHRNFDNKWTSVSFGGGTRVMTGWQMVKDLHFRKHSASATHHPVYGWQAGPETPLLRLLLLLDGEAADMDEFELDLLGISWAHVTIFLIGVDGCPHHHRHANELQRISDVNHHVSFVDAQGNAPERFVTHELLKRHLGLDIPLAEFEEMEQPPPYTA